MGVTKRELSGGIDVDVILDTCSTIQINVIISSAYQNTPGPSGHTNV